MDNKIAIYASSTGENSFGVGKSYLDLISHFGVARILTPDNLYEEDIDLLLLPGGADLSPKSYGGIPHWFTSNTDVFKQHVYDECLPNYINHGKPILGICLGHQQLAARFGSAITQNLPFHPTSTERWKRAHDATPENAEAFYKGKGKFDVNSFHHQGVLREDLSDVLMVTAFAENEEYKNVEEKQIVESFMHRDLPIAGIQWHPEDMLNQFAYNLIYHLLNR